MKRLVKLFISLLVHGGDLLQARCLRVIGRKPRPTCVILYYHGIDAAQRRRFQRQMDLLLEKTCPLCAAENFALNGRGHYSAVTFDDGFVSVLKNALPELQKRDIPATLFVPTGYLGAAPGWIDHEMAAGLREEVMSVEQLRSVGRQPLVTIGSHSVTHPNFLLLNETRARLELSESKADLENVLGRPVTTFSFPHGACNRRTVELARAAGYERVFTIAPEAVGAMDKGFVFGRVAVDPRDWDLEFRLKLLGAYRWLAKKASV